MTDEIHSEFDYDPLIDEFYNEILSEGGFLLFADWKKDFFIVYDSSQWNDNGIDPDSIRMFYGTKLYTKDGHYVHLYKNKAYFHDLETGFFHLDISLSVKDFVTINSSIDIVLGATNIADLVDANSNKQIEIIFDEKTFINKIRKYKNLLVFS